MDDVKFVLRLPPRSHKKVKKSAKDNNTSMNKEISNIIDTHYAKTSIETRLDAIEKAIANKLKKK